MLCYPCMKSLFACHLFLFPDKNFYPSRFYYGCDQLSVKNQFKIRFHEWMKEEIIWISFFNRNAFVFLDFFSHLFCLFVCLFGVCSFSYWSFRQYLFPVVNMKTHDLKQRPISLFCISLILCLGCYLWYIDTYLCLSSQVCSIRQLPIWWHISCIYI